MKKIVITGPECSGKTTLANDLGAHYSVPVISEYAREYLHHLDRPYNASDLEIIAKEQDLRERAYSDLAFIICDTSFLVLKIWSQVKYQFVSPFILSQLAESPATLYLLPHYDIPYEEDPLREHPTERARLYQLYLDELNHQEVPWFELVGNPKQRLEQAQTKIDACISDKC